MNGLRLHLEHLNKVQNNLQHMVNLLLMRLVSHDMSKLDEQEKPLLDSKEALGNAVFCSDEYQAIIQSIAPAVKHHHMFNPHHPEYHDDVHHMNLFDLVEMLADWKAADEDFQKVMDTNIKRFKIKPELAGCLYATAQELGWL